ncbi:MAG: right-handed parallel beta-helix repeat-containing protein [Myxococcota bacterium]
MHSILILLLILALAGPALAVDGVAEINQSCAVQTGCFGGDAAGYPVTIDGTAGTSYRLTGDLIVPDDDTNGIRVNAPSVTIDLNGFEIVRSGCEGTTTDCTTKRGLGTGVGVEEGLPSSQEIFGITVKNGSITGMAHYGVYLGEQAEVSGLRVRWNRFDGIRVDKGSIVSGSTAYENGRNGIYAKAGSTVLGNAVYENGYHGISVFAGSIVSGNAAYRNGDDGIYTSVGSTVSDNATYYNGDDGIWVSRGSTVYGNTVQSNMNDGIVALEGSSVQRNTVRSNGHGSQGGYGLNLGLNTTYRENTITKNVTGAVTGIGVNLEGNYCDGTGVTSVSCP